MEAIRVEANQEPETRHLPIRPWEAVALTHGSTQLRRPIKGVFAHRFALDDSPADCIKDWDGLPSRLAWAPRDWEMCPHGEPGDVLACKEAAYIAPPNFGDYGEGNATDDDRRRRVVGYAASMCGEAVRCATDYGVRKSSPVTMPAWAVRFRLPILSIRVGRIRDVTEDDARAMGSRIPGDMLPKPCRQAAWSEREVMAKLWEHKYGKGAWARNDWTWVIEHERWEGAK